MFNSGLRSDGTQSGLYTTPEIAIVGGKNSHKSIIAETMENMVRVTPFFDIWAPNF